MPNYFTHLQFGERVLAALPEPLRARIQPQRADFDVGCYGPDPLFFYHLLHDNPVRRVGLRMHKVSALPVFRRLARIISEDRPGAAGYSAGFLCHFALDSGCHGYIEAPGRQADRPAICGWRGSTTACSWSAPALTPSGRLLCPATSFQARRWRPWPLSIPA